MVSGLEACRRYTICVLTKFRKHSCSVDRCVDVETSGCPVVVVASSNHGYNIAARVFVVVSMVLLVVLVVCMFRKFGAFCQSSKLGPEDLIEPRYPLHRDAEEDLCAKIRWEAMCQEELYATIPYNEEAMSRYDEA